MAYISGQFSDIFAANQCQPLELSVLSSLLPLGDINIFIAVLIRCKNIKACKDSMNLQQRGFDLDTRSNSENDNCSIVFNFTFYPT